VKHACRALCGALTELVTELGEACFENPRLGQLVDKAGSSFAVMLGRGWAVVYELRRATADTLGWVLTHVPCIGASV
jgi:hypothetical protein